MDKISINNKLYLEDIESILDLPCNFEILKNKNILITGATGLIGSVLTDMLKRVSEKFNLNLTLILISRHCLNEIEKSDFFCIRRICCDIAKDSILDICKDIELTYIFHLASNVHPLQYAKYPIETITTNVWGTQQLLELASRNLGCRFVLASSVEVYGNLPGNDYGAGEKDFGYLDCNTPRACYNEAKRLCETLCQAYMVEKNTDVVIARLCRCYGPTLKTDDSKALSQFIFKAIKGENIVLKSAGTQFFSYLYSSDAASALSFLMCNGVSGEAYNISDSRSNVYLKDLAKIIADYCGLDVVFDLPSEIEKQGFSKATNAIIDCKKINDLGWHAKFDIESGLKRCIEILREFSS